MEPRRAFCEDAARAEPAFSACASARATESEPQRNPIVMSNRDTESATKSFRGWRLIGFIMCVIVVLAIVSAVVDWVVIGPLEGRMF